MKTVIALSILFCATTLPALGELTDADLDKIRLIVKEELKTEITAVRQELKAEIASSEKTIKNYIDAKIEGVDKRLEGVDKRLSTYNWVLVVLLPLIVAAIGIPTAVIAWRVGTDRSLERRFETLVKEVEMLKEQRIVNP